MLVVEIKRAIKPVLILLLALLLPGAAAALPPVVTETKPDPPAKNKRIVMLVVDGLQSGAVSAGGTPSINGLGMAGVRADRVSAMPPDNTEARVFSLLSGTDPGEHGFTGPKEAPKRRTLLSQLEARGIKTAVIDGSGRLEKACGDASYKNFGPFTGDGQVMAAALEVFRTKKPFLTVAVLAGPGRQMELSGPESKAYQAAVAAADTEVGRFLRQLHVDGTYESTMIIISGATGRPPLIVRGSDFLAGAKLPPVGLKDLAPTLGYLYGFSLPESRGLVVWNALRPAADQTESSMLQQRVKELSLACADAVDAAGRLENEKVLVQEEKSRLARDKKLVEEEIQTRENQIDRLQLTISAFKLAGLIGLILFGTALYVEYRVLKKRYLFFT